MFDDNDDFNSPNPKTCGIVEIDKNKIVKSFVEKPQTIVKFSKLQCMCYLKSF